MSQAQSTTTSQHDAFGRGTWAPMAGWWPRVAARLIDELFQAIGVVPYVIGLVMMAQGQGSVDGIYLRADPENHTDSTSVLIGLGLMMFGGLLSLVIWIWNRVLQQGRTGQSMGKSLMGIVLVSARTGQPIGAGTSFLREIAHVLDGFFYLGYLWPLWDERKQTFADKLVGTVVAQAPREKKAAEPTWAQRALMG